nr:hypothetical protein [Pseudohalocynthiibacter aestuariivivens]
MVGLIDDQDGLKAAVDLNTRVTAELGIILTQIWRLEARKASAPASSASSMPQPSRMSASSGSMAVDP